MAEGKGHTELPWHVSGKQSIRGPNGEYVAKANWRDGFENASFIVAAVNTCPAVEGLVRALEDWLYYAEENLSEFDYEDCYAEKLCHRCESSGCINLKIRNARNALSRFRSLQNGGAND